MENDCGLTSFLRVPARDIQASQNGVALNPVGSFLLEKSLIFHSNDVWSQNSWNPIGFKAIPLLTMLIDK